MLPVIAGVGFGLRHADDVGDAQPARLRHYSSEVEHLFCKQGVDGSNPI